MTDNSWELSDDGGLTLDPYYDDDLIEGAGEPTRRELFMWQLENLWWPVIRRWRAFKINHRLHRCPGCRKIYRFSGSHANCPIPF